MPPLPLKAERRTGCSAWAACVPLQLLPVPLPGSPLAAATYPARWPHAQPLPPATTRPSSFFLAKTLTTSPIVVAESLLFAGLVYFMVGYQASAAKFLAFAVTLVSSGRPAALPPAACLAPAAQLAILPRALLILGCGPTGRQQLITTPPPHPPPTQVLFTLASETLGFLCAVATSDSKVPRQLRWEAAVCTLHTHAAQAAHACAWRLGNQSLRPPLTNAEPFPSLASPRHAPTPTPSPCRRSQSSS